MTSPSRPRASAHEAQAEESTGQRSLPLGYIALGVCLVVAVFYLYHNHQGRLREERAIESTLSEADTFILQHPLDFDGGIGRLEEIRRKAAAGEFERLASLAQGRIEATQQKKTDYYQKRAAAAVLNDLRQRANQLAAAGDYEGAKSVLTGYTGSLAAETEGERNRLAGEIPEMRELLLDMQKRATSHLIFPSPFDPSRPRDESAIRHAITRACRKVEIRHVAPHGLRSYFVTQARESGLTDAEIAMLIGDKIGPAIIAQTYGDVRPDHLFKQAQRIVLRATGRAAEASCPVRP